MTDINAPEQTKSPENTLRACAEAFGGRNYFLQLIEALRESRTHPLLAHQCEFRFSLGSITWGKVIYHDKVELLKKLRGQRGETANLIPPKNSSEHKKTMNLLRTLGPVVFKVKPANKKDGKGFTIQPFQIIDDQTTVLNPVFDAVFFLPPRSVKKMMA